MMPREESGIMRFSSSSLTAFIVLMGGILAESQDRWPDKLSCRCG